MSEFQVGDRVKTKDEVLHLLARGPFTGTVVWVNSDDAIRVKRDDGVKSLGNDAKEWLTSAAYLEKIQQVSVVMDKQQIESSHIMGLSPEEIDKDAYDSFMRDL